MKKSSKIILIIVSSLIIVLIIVGAFILISNQNKSNKEIADLKSQISNLENKDNENENETLIDNNNSNLTNAINTENVLNNSDDSEKYTNKQTNSISTNSIEKNDVDNNTSKSYTLKLNSDVFYSGSKTLSDGTKLYYSLRIIGNEVEFSINSDTSSIMEVKENINLTTSDVSSGYAYISVPYNVETNKAIYSGNIKIKFSTSNTDKVYIKVEDKNSSEISTADYIEFSKIAY